MLRGRYVRASLPEGRIRSARTRQENQVSSLQADGSTGSIQIYGMEGLWQKLFSQGKGLGSQCYCDVNCHLSSEAKCK